MRLCNVARRCEGNCERFERGGRLLAKTSGEIRGLVECYVGITRLVHQAALFAASYRRAFLLLCQVL